MGRGRKRGGLNLIYFTADQHFGHANIIKHCNRPFGTVAEMDEYLLEQWNNCVGRNDTVYILGDLFSAIRCRQMIIYVGCTARSI